MEEKEIKQDRIRGALYGFAIGDAIGATTEFMEESEIAAKYGYLDDMVGGGWLNLPPGHVTDDTEMSVCVMEALMESDGDEAKFRDILRAKFIDWLDSGPKDVGATCSRSIRYLRENNTAESPYDPNALGNGALMRALPCALAGSWELQVIQAKMTHNNDKQLECLKNYHTAIRQSLAGIDYDYSQYGHYMKPTGHVLNSLVNAMEANSQYSDYESVVLRLVNMGGDADTIAAIGGSFAGAKFGYSAIPQRWIDKLDSKVKDSLEKFADWCSKAEDNDENSHFEP